MKTASTPATSPLSRPVAAANASNLVGAAARLMSETAHDLRSPLTSVREAIRLVRDGDLGQIGTEQGECLSMAMDQCDCMDQMIGEMVQLERLRTGIPRANRTWTPIGDVRRAVDQTLAPWAGPRGIEVLWDISEDPATRVFADPSMLRRLVVNLVTNAIRASVQGSCVLIRLARQSGGESILWSVIDQGAGISDRDIRQISDRQVSMAGGEGLGLSICRQLAAVHFSPLRIRSRLGVGTEVDFETAASGPRSVARMWAKWRVSIRGPLQKPKLRTLTSDSAFASRSDDARSDSSRAAVDGSRVDGSRVGENQRSVRLDPPSVSVELAHEATSPRCQGRLAAGVVSLGAAVSRQVADQFDELLHAQMQLFDLIYRTGTRSWVWVFDTDSHGVADRIGAITDSATATLEGARTVWSPAQMIPIDSKRTAARLSDLMVRESLAESSSARIVSQDQVRLGTAPIAESDAASTRLDAELRRLSEQLNSQTTRLRQQAQKLRPQG